MGSSILESLTIEDVWIQTDSHTVQITVYNTGTGANLGTDSGVDIRIVTIYVNGTALANPSLTPSSINFNTLILSGRSMTVPCNFSVGFQHGNSYYFKIVTARGSNFGVQIQY